HVALLLLVKTDAAKERGPVVGADADALVDLGGLFGDDEQRVLLVVLVEYVQRLRDRELVNDGIHGLVPAKSLPCHGPHHGVAAHDRATLVAVVPLRRAHGDDIRAAGGSARAGAHAAAEGVAYAAGSAGARLIPRHLRVRQQVRQD